MRIKILYNKITVDLYGVWLNGKYVGEVRRIPDGRWMFRSCCTPPFVSPAMKRRLLAVALWPGVNDM